MTSSDIAKDRNPQAAVDSMHARAHAFRLLNTALIGVLGQPESVEPYLGILTGIKEIVTAHTGAMYHVSLGTARGTLIASTGDLSKYDARIQDFIASLQQPTPIPSIWFDAKETPGLFIKTIQVSDDLEDEFALLVLICDDAQNVKAAGGESLDILVEGFAAILRATRQAQVNRRRDLQKERATISRELHDSLAQSLTYLKIQASRMQSMLKQEHTGAYDRSEMELVVRELRDNLNIAYRRLRELMTTFRLTMNGEDFGQAIEESVGEFTKRSRIAFNLDNRLVNDELTVDEEMQVLHIVREALSNIVRHSHARRAKVSLYHCENKGIRLIIDDNGVGIDKSQRRAQHLGLIIMQERSRNLGGKFSVREQSGGGTEIRVTFIPQKFTAANQLRPGCRA